MKKIVALLFPDESKTTPDLEATSSELRKIVFSLHFNNTKIADKREFSVLIVIIVI